MPLIRVQARSDTASAWTAANPVLLSGEFGVESNTGKVKVGNGVQQWTALSYIGTLEFSVLPPPAVGTGAVGSSALPARSDHTHDQPSAVVCNTAAVSGNASVGGSLTVTGSLVGGSHSHTAANISDFTEAAQDAVAAALMGGEAVSVTYNDAAGTITIAVTGTLDCGTYTGTLV